MKISPSFRKRSLLALALLCIVGGAFGFSRWRHPKLPETLLLPAGARMTYSQRYFNLVMTGPALYYRIESPQPQRQLALSISGSSGSEFQVVARSSLSLRQEFKQVAFRDVTGDKALAFPIRNQEFPTESDSFNQCYVWQTSRGSVAEIFVWTKF